MSKWVIEAVSDLRLLTKGLIAGIVSLALAMQLDVVKNYVTPILAQHPKISAVVMGLAGLGLLLQQPQVRKVLHLDDLLVEDKKDDAL